MFDVNKIRRISEIFGKLARDRKEIYLIPVGIFTIAENNLFRRFNLQIKAIMLDTDPQKELFGIPIIKTAQASANFNENTVLIIITKKPSPLFETTFDFKVNGGTWTIPALVISIEETTAIYDCMNVLKTMQEYKEDNVPDFTQLDTLANHFARGLTAISNPHSHKIKIDVWDSSSWFKRQYTFDDTAIVIQGPIEYTNNYTVETFKLYRSIYPNVPIVISTWKGGATDTFRKECKKNSVVLLENEMPTPRGIANINLQLKSSLQGVKFIRDNTNAKFVLKTRTDQRIDYFDFLIYFKNLLETFPPKGDKLHKRIIFLGSRTQKTFPFNFHDFLSFGHILDISKLYDIPFHGEEGKLSYLKNHFKRIIHIGHLLMKLDYNVVTEQSHKLFKLNKMMNRIYWPEVYISRTFYEKYIAPVDSTKLFETSWKFAVNYLILIDFDTINFDWPKYEDKRYKIKFKYYGQSAFARWLDMYRNFKIDWV